MMTTHAGRSARVDFKDFDLAVLLPHCSGPPQQPGR